MTEEKATLPQQPQTPASVADDQLGFAFSSHIVIRDPDTGQVLVNIRGD